MILEWWAYLTDTTSITESTNIMTLTTPEDQALTANSNPVQGKLEVSAQATLTLYKIGPSDADITFTLSRTDLQQWVH